MARHTSKMPNSSSLPRMHLQPNPSTYSVFFFPENTSSTKSDHNKSISYHQGRKQEYLISCFLSILFCVPLLPCRTRRKRAIRRHLESTFRFRTDCLEPPSLIAYLASLSSTHLQLLMYFKKRYHICLKNRWGWWNWYIEACGDKRNQYMCCFIRYFSKANVSHIIRVESKRSYHVFFPVFSFALGLTCKTGRKKAIS